MDLSLSLTGAQHALLHAHLFPADGCEAVAIAVCGRRAGGDKHRLLIRKIYLVPYEACAVRRPDQVTWPTDLLVPILQEADASHHTVVKVHGHPNSYPQFSPTDDEADRQLFPSITGWVEADVPHASVIMLKNGAMFGRTIDTNGKFCLLHHVLVVGDDLRIWHANDFNPTEAISHQDLPEFTRRHAQAFGRGTVMALGRLSVAVIGCSGTGSPVIEQLARLGIGRLVLVDPDTIEEKNLNRILNATMDDAIAARPKVDVMARAVRAMGLGTVVETWPRDIFHPAVVRAVAGCDLVFGCMDSVEGRYFLNRLATFYLLPYIDVGVRLEADGNGSISQICGTVHYLQPGRSSLLSRGLITMERVRAEGTRRRNPAAYAELRRERYIAGMQEDRPAVISVNMQLAAMAVNELLARLHSYRDESNSDYASLTISISQVMFYPEPEGPSCRAFARDIGRGDVTPLLDEVELTERHES